MEPLLICEHVWFAYPSDDTKQNDWVLRDIQLSIFPEEYIAIVGNNGSGKSTLARLFNGLLVPSKGKVKVGEWLTDYPGDLWKIRQLIGLVFQNPDHQIVGSTVQDDIIFGLENMGLRVDQMQQRLDEVLSRVGLQGLEMTNPEHLSGGQKQRLAIAGVIAMSPEMIVFDEATSMLDPRGANEILQIINQLHQQGSTIVHITHSVNQIPEDARVIVLDEGKQLLDIHAQQMIQYIEYFHRLGLQVPLHFELAHRLSQHGWTFDTDLKTREDMVREIWTYLSKM